MVRGKLGDVSEDDEFAVAIGAELVNALMSPNVTVGHGYAPLRTRQQLLEELADEARARGAEAADPQFEDRSETDFPDIDARFPARPWTPPADE